MRIPLYQIDAFTDRAFGGNPAAVCPLQAWLPDETLQAIALENNLSETAFLVPEGADYRLRWFTPAVEVDLCGHATLASAHVVLTSLAPERKAVAFETRSGTLVVRRADGGRLTMDFPLLPVSQQVEASDALSAAMGKAPQEAWKIREAHGAPYMLLRYADAGEVAALRPRFGDLPANVIATAEGAQAGVDFVSRFFAPLSGIDEDPVTGSAHCTLAPFWAERLGRNSLTGRQISARGGTVDCELRDGRVFLTGTCAFYMEGRIELPD